MIFAISAARRRNFHHFAAPAFDVTKTHTIRFEHFLNGVGGGLQLYPAARRDAQRIFLRLDVLKRFYTGLFAHGEDQAVPGWKDADGAERNLSLVEAATEVGHRRKPDRIAETEIVFLFVDQNRRPRAAQFGVAPAHRHVELRLRRQLDIVEKSKRDDVGDINALG